MAIHDDDRPAKRKGLILEPLHKDVPATQTPTVSHSNSEELDALREQISAINHAAYKDDPPNPKVFVIPQQQTAQPVQVVPPDPKETTDKKATLNIVRSKLSKLYAREPDAIEESIETFQITTNRTVHQQFMYDLTNSGKGLAQIQTEWHNYYSALPDSQKHDVWQEFYQANNQHPAAPEPTHHTRPSVAHPHKKIYHSQNDGEQRTVADIKKQVLKHVSANGKLSTKHHLQSLLFGLMASSVFILVLLFGFFNERFIAPFISPSRQVSATPIIGTGGVVGPESKIIIPKINLEVPVVYDLNTTDEKTVQAGLERGVVHYSTSSTPGQTGNTVIVGHSSNNILNKGQYKFAFVLLKQLEIGDTFSLNKGGVRYTYQIFDKKIVKPTDTEVLGVNSRPTTATLITCDPPGTSLNRLVVVGEQISPDPSGNKIVTQTTPTLTDAGVLPSNAPSLWQKIKDFF